MPETFEQTDQFYVYGAYGELLAQYNGLSLSYWNILSGGETIGRAHPDESRYYYLKDHLGSVRVTVNDTGTAVGWEACPEPAFRRSRRDYFPFGLHNLSRLAGMPGRSFTARLRGGFWVWMRCGAKCRFKSTWFISFYLFFENPISSIIFMVLSFNKNTLC